MQVNVRLADLLVRDGSLQTHFPLILRADTDCGGDGRAIDGRESLLDLTFQMLSTGASELDLMLGKTTLVISPDWLRSMVHFGIVMPAGTNALAFQHAFGQAVSKGREVMQVEDQRTSSGDGLRVQLKVLAPVILIPSSCTALQTPALELDLGCLHYVQTVRHPMPT